MLFTDMDGVVAIYDRAAFIENPDKLPQTDDSTAQFMNRFSSILMGYTDRGILVSSMARVCLI